MRKLASVRRVDEIRPIDGADAIECAVVGGWTCVVKKGEFRPGDLGVYFEIDSFLPGDDPRYAFLEPRFIEWNGKRGARIKTMKLRGQLSQGLLVPLNDFLTEDCAIEEGADLTDVLGIEKWERLDSGNVAGEARGLFPTFLQKTDQERVQNMKWVLEDTERQYEVTIKLDGSSCTAYVVQPNSPYYEVAAERAMKDNESFVLGVDPVIGVCSRNIELKEDMTNIFWSTLVCEGIIDYLKNCSASVAIQGELVAPSIQGNYEKVSKPEFYVYDVFDINDQCYEEPSNRQAICSENNLKHVPVLYPVWSFPVGMSVFELLEMADGQGMNAGVKREGLVFKEIGGQLSFKTISNSYLLKTGN